MVHLVSDKADFDNQLAEAGKKLVVVDFFAQWCGPCKIIAPKVEAMSQVYTDVVFLKVDVDENDEVAATYKISCMPTFAFFKNGKLVHEFSGANEEMLKSTVEKLRH
ncbi:Thioredoxin-2 [Chamberlinius hualienensis]